MKNILNIQKNMDIEIEVKEEKTPTLVEETQTTLKEVIVSTDAEIYPASFTAEMIFCESTEPSTPIELVRRLTEQDLTPSTELTAFSTLATQAAQLIPVT